jgi:hypothetical protein
MGWFCFQLSVMGPCWRPAAGHFTRQGIAAIVNRGESAAREHVMKNARNFLILTAALFGFCMASPGAIGEAVRTIDLPVLLTMVANSGTANQDTLQNGLYAITLTAPPKNPGTKAGKLALKKEYSAASLEALVAEHPELKELAVSNQACRVDYLERCLNIKPAFKEKFMAGFAKAGLNMNNHEGRYSHLNVIPLAGYNWYSRSPAFNDGKISMVAALVQEETLEVGAYNISIDARKLNISAGSPNSIVQITGVDIAQSDFLISFDAGERCTEGKREFGFLVRVALGSGPPTVKWVSPKNTSDSSFVVSGDTVYTVNGGSCVEDFLYAIDFKTGKVLSRLKLPSGADFITSDGQRLLLGLYEGAVTYRLP